MPTIASSQALPKIVSDNLTDSLVYASQTKKWRVIAARGRGLRYQWQVNSGSGWTDISGATAANYTTPVTVRSTDNGKRFRCVVSNQAGRIVSRDAVLSVWNPTVISGAIWFDPTLQKFTERTSPATGSTDGNPVGTWRDVTGTINAIAPGDTARPIYRATGLNGTPAMEFDGSNDYLSLTTSLAAQFQNKPYVYIFAGVSCATSTSERVIFQASVNATASSRIALSLNQGSTSGRIAAGGRRVDADSFASAPLASGFESDEPMVVGAEFLFASSDCHTRKNGTRKASNTSFQTDGNTANSTSQGVQIGATATPAVYYAGMLGNLVIVTPASPLTENEIGHIEAFIASRHNLPQLDWDLNGRSGGYTAATVSNQVTIIDPSGGTQTESDLASHRYRHYAEITVHRGRTWVAYGSCGTAEDNSGQQVHAHYSDDKGATWSAPILVVPSQSNFSTADTMWPVGKRVCFPRMFQTDGDNLYLISTINQSGIDGSFSGIIGIAMLATLINPDGTMGATVRISPSSYTQVDSKALFSYDAFLNSRLFLRANRFGMHGGSAPSQTPSDWLGWEQQNGVEFLELSTEQWQDDPERLVRLMRAFPTDPYNAVYMNRSENGGSTRDAIRRTNVPNAPAVTRILRLNDGRYAIVGNHGSTRTEIYLALTGVDDLKVLSVHSIISGVSSTPVYAGTGKNGGASYVDLVQRGNYLYVAYSMRKESIGFSRVLIPGLSDNDNDG